MTSEPSLPTLCDACVQLGVLMQTSCRHTFLELMSERPLLDNAIERRFRCTNCNTIWLRQTDRWGIDGDFRLAPNTII